MTRLKPPYDLCWCGCGEPVVDTMHQIHASMRRELQNALRDPKRQRNIKRVAKALGRPEPNFDYLEHVTPPVHK